MSTVRRAVVLAAGRGTRMMPLTADRPKPLIPVAGRPILERILLGLRAAGIEEAIIVHGYLGAMIEAYFGTGTRVGLRLSYCAQQTQDGTAGAVRLTEVLCAGEPFLLHWGDILVSPENYLRLLAAYTASPVPPAGLVGMNWVEDPWAGAAVYREDGRVTAIVEKPPPGTSTTHWNNAGVLVLGPHVWPYLHRITPSARGEYEFTDVVRGMLAGGERVLGCEFVGFWSDVGTPEVVAALNADPRLLESC